MQKDQSSQMHPPFACQYSPQVSDLLSKLNCSIAISTYQAGKLVLVSAKDENSLIQLPRSFKKPMGIAHDYENDKLALACKDEVIVFANSVDLAAHYPKAPKRYDALYMPRMTYHTGPLDIHDLSYGKNGKLYAVNSLFSCLMSLDDSYNFTPYWQPSFIDKLASEDRCHLNGMAMADGLPKYVTAFNEGNSFQSWRENILTSGVVIDVDTSETIVKGLGMPHTPRFWNNQLFMLLSATSQLVKVDFASGKVELIKQLSGFVRGMDLYKDYLFIGKSKLRKNSSTFAELPFADQAQEAGITILHLPTGSIVGEIKYLNSLDEIYDVHILPNMRRPNIMNTISEDHKAGLMIPDSTYWAKKQA